MRRRPRRRGQKGRSPGKILFIMLLAVALFLIFDGQVRPYIRVMVENQTRLISTEAINGAVSDVLTEEGIDYDTLIHIQKDGEGNISSIQTDMSKVNILKSSVTLKIQEKLQQAEQRGFSIPIGTLLGNDWLRDRGPSVSLKFTLHGNIKCNLKSRFESAGINQTKHSLMLEVETHVNAMIPWFKAEDVTETTEFCVAETVIVGSVPEVYANLSGENTSSVTDIMQMGGVGSALS